MIINELGATYTYDGIIYTIGERIVGTPMSRYCGLLGIITEIRTDDDKETENEMPDILCSFEAPIFPEEIKALEERFSSIYNEPKTIGDIVLDRVVMEPNMIQKVPKPTQLHADYNGYIVITNWAVDFESDVETSPIFTNLTDAKQYMAKAIKEEQREGCIERWQEDECFVEDITPTSYECYLDGEYCQNHFCVKLIEQPIMASSEFLSGVSDLYSDICQLEDIHSQVKDADLDELQMLTDEQYNRFMKDSSLVERFKKALSNNDSYCSAYWETVDMVIKELIDEYLEQEPNTTENGGQKNEL